MASFQAKDLPSKVRRRLWTKPPGNRRESRETSHIFMAAPMGNTVPDFGKTCTVNPRNSGKSPFQIFVSYLVFRPRLSGHALRPRLPTCQSNRGTSFSGKLGFRVGAQRLRTRGKPFSGFGPDDCETLTTAFFFGQLHRSVLSSVGLHSLDLESAR